MKKYVSIIAILLVLTLTACSNQETPPSTDNSGNTQSGSITMLDEGIWPENEYTEGLPIPPGTVSWATLDTEHENCTVNIVDISETQYNEYMELLKQEGFSVIEKVSNKTYKGNELSMRIIADHIRTAVFIAADPTGIKPSNTDQGYILRRLIRRAIRHAKKLQIDINSNWEEQIACAVMDEYQNYYPELKENREVVLEVLRNEKIKFNRTLEKGLREFEKILSHTEQKIPAEEAFKLYDTYGFPIELTVELAQEKNIQVDVDGFQE